MPILNKGTAFSNGEQLTADKLNDLVDLATFDQSATDSASTTVNTSGQIVVADSGVSTAKIADANVTFAKLTDVIDDDTMATATATNLATSESIKAYVDGGGGFTPSTYIGGESVTLPNGLIMKFGTVTSNGGVQSFTFATAFPTACLNLQGQKSTVNDNNHNLSYTSLSSTGWTMNPSSSGTYSWTAFGY